MKGKFTYKIKYEGKEYIPEEPFDSPEECITHLQESLRELDNEKDND